MSLTLPPEPEELEVSVFGPGRGECVVVHLGYGEWCVIDSCLVPGSRVPASVHYLATLGKETLSRVRLILATHWHDDHIRGIAASLREFSNAKFCCSMAINSEQFATLVKLASAGIQRNSGVEEFAGILESLMERRGRLPQSLVTPTWAIQSRKILDLNQQDRPFHSKLIALSPSDGTIKRALDKLAQLVPRPGSPQLRIANRAPNETSVAVLVDVGGRRVLLGADLEHAGRVGEGWLAVLESCQGVAPAKIFKVPHHGSPNADCPEVWQELLEPDALALLTPFTSGKGLPREEDIGRLRTRTQNLYCTAQTRAKLPKRDHTVEKLIRNVERRAVEGNLGHLRIRWSVSDAAAEPRVEMFNGAFRA